MKIDKQQLGYYLWVLFLLSACGGGSSETDSRPAFKVSISEIDITRLDSGQEVDTAGIANIRGVTLKLNEN